MILASSGLPGGPLGGLLGHLGGIVGAFWTHLRPSWVHLGPSWRHLGAILAVLEAILAVLEASWRPSWAILAVLEAISSHLGGFFVVVDVVWGPSGWPAGRAGAHWGSSFGKRTKTKDERVQHAVHPCDESTGGGGSKTPTANHRRPLPFWKRLCGRKLG